MLSDRYSRRRRTTSTYIVLGSPVTAGIYLQIVCAYQAQMQALLCLEQLEAPFYECIQHLVVWIGRFVVQ